MNDQEKLKEVEWIERRDRFRIKGTPPPFKIPNEIEWIKLKQKIKEKK